MAMYVLQNEELKVSVASAGAELKSALDQKTGRQIMQLFRELNAEKRTIIMITHDMNIAANARRVVHIIDGMITEGGGTGDA